MQQEPEDDNLVEVPPWLLAVIFLVGAMTGFIWGVLWG